MIAEQDPRNVSLNELDLPPSIYSALAAHGEQTVADILAMSKRELFAVLGMKRQKFSHVIHCLTRHGLLNYAQADRVLMLYATKFNQEANKPIAEIVAGIGEPFTSDSIEWLGLTVEPYHALRRAELCEISAIFAKSYNELLATRGFGISYFNELIISLYRHHCITQDQVGLLRNIPSPNRNTPLGQLITMQQTTDIAQSMSSAELVLRIQIVEEIIGYIPQRFPEILKGDPRFVDLRIDMLCPYFPTDGVS